MLIFVGEDLEILSIASRREEAAWKAPAIADVITREDIDNAGEATIADLLGKSAGFYINKRERGSVLYLRGVSDSVLFLHDTVPVGSGAHKSDHYIDNELSLASIKRIEIVRGAGSVLWGPDAFAGVVNAVPMTGKDLQGFETGVGISSLDEAISAYLNYGTDHGRWNSFVSVSARSAAEDDRSFNVVGFWNDVDPPVDPDHRFGRDTPGNSEYIELFAGFSLENRLTLSARLSDNTRVYSVSDRPGDLIWKEERSAPTRTFKIELSKETDIDSGIRFTGYYTKTGLDQTIIDKEFDQSESSLYAELIYDQALFVSHGLLTAGASWRKTEFDDILVWKNFMPDYLDEENTDVLLLDTDVLPLFETKDYENRLTSVFGQYRHRFTNLELWAGLRNDDHDRFEDKISYSLGAAWNFSPDLILKTIYGTAYRTPFAQQVKEKAATRLERIDSTNVQIAWKPEKERKVSLTLFRNEIDNHVIDDRYTSGGLSTSNSQTIYGAELEGEFRITEALSVSGNITILNNSGPDETYLYWDYAYVDRDGKVRDYFQVLNYAYDIGTDTMVNFALNWNLTKNIAFVPELHYISEAQLHYLYKPEAAPAEKITIECPDVWLMDMHLKINDVFPFCIDFFVENLWDEHYETPGLYSVKEGKSFNAGVLIKMTW
ncbi:MAG: TonB-dependent receptor [Deltaproteobacteria bacterium]|nr:TonB-dependent receptor [Deltaproteobacteria bacterium]